MGNANATLTYLGTRTSINTAYGSKPAIYLTIVGTMDNIQIERWISENAPNDKLELLTSFAKFKDPSQNGAIFVTDFEKDKDFFSEDEKDNITEDQMARLVIFSVNHFLNRNEAGKDFTFMVFEIRNDDESRFLMQYYKDLMYVAFQWNYKGKNFCMIRKTYGPGYDKWVEYSMNHAFMPTWTDRTPRKKPSN